MFDLLFLIIGTLYFRQVFLYQKYWDKIPVFEKEKLNSKIFISILVAVRNEEKNISKLLQCISRQNFSKKQFELILIDDFSTDKTIKIIKEFMKKNKYFHLISLKNTQKTGKKNALKKGLEKAKGDLIITTDADCEMSEKWLSTIISFYEKTKAQMIIAPVILENNLSIFQKMQSLEFLSLVVSGASATKMKKAIMCNGANLIYEKKILDDFNDFFKEKTVSGDDIFLLLNLKKNVKNKILFLKSKNATVKTKAQNNILDFISQRKRWASKTKYYKDFDIIYTAILVFMTNFLLIASLIFSYFEKKFFLYFLALFLIKSIIDFIFLKKATKFFGKNNLLNVFFILQLFYFFYIVIIGFLSTFFSFRWKGRKVK